MTTVPAPPAPGDFEPAPVAGGIKARSVRAGVALGLAQGGSHAVRFAAMLLLARILTPGDFGLVAMVASLVGVVEVLQEFGLSTVTVQRRALTSAQASALFWVRVAAGVAVALLCAALAAPVATFAGDERAAWITLALGGGFFVSGLGAQHRALLQRMLRFRELARRELLVVAGSALTALALAWQGAGYWALVGYALADDAIGTLLAWRYCRWRPGPPRFDGATREMLAQGSYVAGFGVMAFLGRNVQNVLIGRVHGVHAVGLFTRAFGLVGAVQNYASAALGVVAVPSLARYQDDAGAFRRYYLQALRVAMLAAAPAACFAAVYARELMVVLFGDQWVPSAEPLRVLAPCLLLQPLAHSSGWLFQARGRTRDMMLWGLVGWATLIACMAAGLPYGLVGVAAGYSGGIALLLLPNMIYAMKGTQVTPADLFRCWWPATSAAAAAALAAAVLVPPGGTPSLLRLALAAAVFGAGYLAILAGPLRQGAWMRDVLAQLGRRPPAAAP